MNPGEIQGDDILPGSQDELPGATPGDEIVLAKSLQDETIAGPGLVGGDLHRGLRWAGTSCRFSWQQSGRTSVAAIARAPDAR